MDKDIILNIKGSQRNVQGEGNSIELVTQGKLYKIDDVYYIEYDESELSGMEGTKTQISIRDDSITMERIGNHPSQFFFEKGKKYINSMSTPLGPVVMEIYPTTINHKINDDQGKLDVRYQLGIGGKHVSSNELKLFYK
ncbi:MAG TPA: DUF1934 domain-containing protein [Bacillota bacterium]|nr:DUF1934 domain-containing protein [Bacillota bacterium]